MTSKEKNKLQELIEYAIQTSFPRVSPGTKSAVAVALIAEIAGELDNRGVLADPVYSLAYVEALDFFKRNDVPPVRVRSWIEYTRRLWISIARR